MRIRDDEPSTATVLATLALGALAGFAVGVVLAQKSGGIAGIAAGVRRRVNAATDDDSGAPSYEVGETESADEIIEEEEEEEERGAATALERRVLRAFRGDEVLSERAIDISVTSDGVVELSGWVDSDDEARLAAAVARKLDGVSAVVNRIAVGDADGAGFADDGAGKRDADARSARSDDTRSARRDAES